jgi:hypothetical protein
MTKETLSRIHQFGEELLDDERTVVEYEEAVELAGELRIHPSVVLRELKGFGFELHREPPRRVRGINTSSNDRFFGPGSMPSHGGSGWETIQGFGGREG